MLIRTIIIVGSLLASVAITSADSLITWSEFDDKQENIDLFLRLQSSDNTILERQIGQGGNHVTPSMHYSYPLIWLTWADRTDLNHYVLRYAILGADTLEILETGKVNTHDKDVYSPSISMAPDHTPWIAWAGFDGNDEEVKLAHYDKGHWSIEQSVTQNDTPDSTPRFETLADGTLSLAWEETTRTAVVTRRTPIESISNRQSTIKRLSSHNITRKIDAQQKRFNTFKNFPDSLARRKKNILMGNRVEIPR